jgi:3',5'-cyclic AMP phosphodiesterase CpdA
MGDHAAARGADFVITTGDNFYEDGVGSVDDENWRSSFQEIYTDPSLDIPWYPVLGNHDYRGSTQAQIDYSRGDGRWSMARRYHSFERPVGGGRALFVFLDTTPLLGGSWWTNWRHPDLRDQDPADQLQWLDELLGQSTAEWKIVVGHHPLFSAGAMHGPTRGLRNRLQPIFEEHGVHVCFSGHDHNLQHLKPPGPTHYVISGGGSEARRVGTHKSVLFVRGVSGFVSATLRGDSLSLEFIDDGGATIYRADIPRRSGPPEGEP